MEIFQELSCTVKSTYKHFTEHMATDISRSKEEFKKADNKKDSFSVNKNPSAKNDEVNLIASTNTTNDDITTDDDSGIEEIEEWIDIKNIPRLEGSNYDSQGNSLRSSYSSSLSDVNNIQTFCSKEDIHSQLLLEADFYVKAFPRRAFPSYIESMLSPQSQRRKSTL